MADRFVIYQDNFGIWHGGAEFLAGSWPRRTLEHAPVTHADTPEEVFTWLLERYPRCVIAYDPAVTRRYKEKPKAGQ